jgi:hypothetical protein
MMSASVSFVTPELSLAGVFATALLTLASPGLAPSMLLIALSAGGPIGRSLSAGVALERIAIYTVYFR